MISKILAHLLLLTFVSFIVFPISPARAIVLPVSWRTSEESMNNPNAWPSHTERPYVFMKRLIATPPQISDQTFTIFCKIEEWLGEDIMLAYVLAGIAALGIHIQLFYGFYRFFQSTEKANYSGKLGEFINRSTFMPLRRHSRRPSVGKALTSPFGNEKVREEEKSEDGNADGDIDGMFENVDETNSGTVVPDEKNKPTVNFRKKVIDGKFRTGVVCNLGNIGIQSAKLNMTEETNAKANGHLSFLNTDKKQDMHSADEVDGENPDSSTCVSECVRTPAAISHFLQDANTGAAVTADSEMSDTEEDASDAKSIRSEARLVM